MKVLSLLPRSRFTESGMTLPETLSLHFLPPNGSHVLIAAAESAQALLLPPSQPYVDAFCLERMPSIRFIQTTGAGFDSVDHLTAAELGIPVSNSPNMNASSVAEYVMAAIVNLQRGLAWADGEIRRGRYAASRAELLEQGGLELRGCRIGLFGLGNIGRAVVPLAKAFGCSVAACDAFWPEEFAAENGSSVWMWRSCSPSATWFPALPAQRQYPQPCGLQPAFVHEAPCPVDQRGPERCGGGSGSRPYPRGRRIRGARSTALRTTGAPKILSVHSAERVLLTPHLAGATRAAFGRMLSQALENLERVLFMASRPVSVVNGVLADYSD
ncbi:MAG: NAD(P)-dependent oxidoreductase [Bilophila wadsworthia]